MGTAFLVSGPHSLLPLRHPLGQGGCRYRRQANPPVASRRREVLNLKGKKMKLSSVCVATLLCLSGAAQAQVVNIDATNGMGNLVSITDGVCPACLFVGNQLILNAGTYTVTPVNSSFAGALYIAANRFSNVNLPDTGWEWALWMKVGGDPLSSKIGFGGGITTNPPGYQASAAAAFAAAPIPFNFTVTGAGTPVKFLWADDGFGDNTPGSGISLNVTAVPEPGTYAMLLAGLAAVGFVVKRRRG